MSCGKGRSLSQEHLRDLFFLGNPKHVLKQSHTHKNKPPISGKLIFWRLGHPIAPFLSSRATVRILGPKAASMTKPQRIHLLRKLQKLPRSYRSYRQKNTTPSDHVRKCGKTEMEARVGCFRNRRHMTRRGTICNHYCKCDDRQDPPNTRMPGFTK